MSINLSNGVNMNNSTWAFGADPESVAYRISNRCKNSEAVRAHRSMKNTWQLFKRVKVQNRVERWEENSTGNEMHRNKYVRNCCLRIFKFRMRLCLLLVVPQKSKHAVQRPGQRKETIISMISSRPCQTAVSGASVWNLWLRGCYQIHCELREWFCSCCQISIAEKSYASV